MIGEKVVCNNCNDTGYNPYPNHDTAFSTCTVCNGVKAIDKNRLIAEFMGWKYTKTGKHAGNYKSGKWCPYRLRDIKYDTSWDWLMPVVEKIESLGYSTIIKNIPEASINMVSIIDYNPIPINSITNTGFETKIEAVYVAVIAFIEWYNTNPPLNPII